jgi:alpha-D-ribose 1-methylphosphonate 5-triphosphate synthase subunit PhnG
MKQETLEQVAKNITKKYVNEREKQTAYLEFIEGAKWQQEQDLSMVQGYLSANLQNIELLKRSYSEEEVRKISLDFFYYWWNSKGTNTEQGFDKWFEQFKKK